MHVHFQEQSVKTNIWKEIESDTFFKIQTENKLGDSKIRVPAGFEPVGAPGLKFEKISDMQTIIPVKHLIDIQSL